MPHFKLKNLKQQHMRKIVITVFVIVIAIFLLFLLGNTVCAAGLVDNTIKASNEYSKYPLANYQLDFYVDSSWSWLPWNWADDIGKQITYGFYVITNAIWIGSNFISSATGYLVQEAYKLDFITSTADAIGKNIQTVAGVSKSGFSSDGFYSGFSMFLILGIGLYTLYTGIIKKETTKAIHAVVSFVAIFVLSTGFIAYAPDYIKDINGFSSDLSTASLKAGTKIILPGSNTKGQDSVDLIRDSLFAIQVKQPWTLLEFGDSDVKTVGADRVKALVSANPLTNNGKDREDVVKNEIEKSKNNNLTVTDIAQRFGMVIFIFAFNFGISIFVFLLTGIMIFSQVLFIIFAMFLPVSFLLSMIPTFESMTKRAIMKLFNVIMLRAGITLIITTAFSISSMLYSLSSSNPFFLIAFLQIVTFAGIYFKLGDLMGMFSLTGGEAHSFGRHFLQKHKNLLRKVQKFRHPFSKNKSINKSKPSEKNGHVSGKADHSRTSSFRNKAGQTVGKIMDTKDYIKDTAGQVRENIKDLPDNAKYALYHKKSQVKDGINDGILDFKNGIVDAKQKRQQQRNDKQEEHRQNIAKRRLEMENGNGIKYDSDQEGSKQNVAVSDKFINGIKSKVRPNIVNTSGTKKSSAVSNEELRKNTDDKVSKDSNIDPLNKNASGKLNVKRPSSVTNEKLKKNVKDKASKDNNIDPLNKNVPGKLNVKRSPVVPNKELRQNTEDKVSKDNNVDSLNKSVPGNLNIKKPFATVNKELRKNTEGKVLENNTSDSLNKSVPENLNIKKPFAMANKELRKSTEVRVPEVNTSNSSNKSTPQNLNIEGSSAKVSKVNVSVPNKDSSKPSFIKKHITDITDHDNELSGIVSNRIKQNHGFVVKRRVDKKKSSVSSSLKRRNKK